MDSKSINAIEAVGHGQLSVLVEGRRTTLPDARDLSVDEIMLILHAQALRELTALHLPHWKIAAATARWAAHHDLPDFSQSQRLLYLVDRYRNEIEFDLSQFGQDLTELFRARAWRKLLNLIDHLPRNSWFTEAVSNDEEHAAMVAKAMAERSDDEPDSHPPMRTWSSELEMLAKLVDAVRANTYTLAAVNSGKGSPPPPEPRPQTALERAQKIARHQRRKAKHEALVARMLPHKAAKPS
jgi:hypothetical protein